MSHSLSTILWVGTQFELKFSNDQQYLMDQLILTSGSGQLIWDELKTLDIIFVLRSRPCSL
ncbi:MAG: hypothetical protein IPF93_24705 [Saprospiraceae bacterium]|nr:hypothetical protein [Saprospiraceae bacterium]